MKTRKEHGLRWLIAGLLVTMVVGCSVVNKTSPIEVFKEYEVIGKLDQTLLDSREKEVDTYAPTGFGKARKLLEESVDLAQKGKGDKAVAISKEGLVIAEKAMAAAEKSKTELWDVNEYRSRAIKAGAPDLYKDDYKDAEDLLRETAGLIESNQTEKSKKNQPVLIEMYNRLEKDSLEKGVVEYAKLAFEQAKENGANKYAPHSYKRAQKELDVALSLIETDRSRKAQADEHAKNASVLAKQSSQISDLVKTFDSRDFSEEDIVLWYWQQLEKINQPLGVAIDFQQPNHAVVEGVRKEIFDLKGYAKESEEIAKKQQAYIETLKQDHMREIAALNTQLEDIMKQHKMVISEQQRAQANKERLEREARQRFEYVQSLFDPSEAQVYRKGDNVLVSVHGFYFPSGVSEIQSSNFGLLNKLLSAINQFPDCKIGVYGHTDAVGAAELNLKLSEKRAENVADFISNVGQIPVERITHNGYGDTRPIASNKTKEGRTQNRRIELIIINES